jgi:2,3-dihydroxyphenylpropionate 1,2-dioxygenase
MGTTVLGIGASHTTLMNTHWHAVTHLDRAERFRDALGNARAALIAAQPDVVVIFGSNHFRGFYLDLIPAFTIGVGECIASGEAGTPSGPQRVDVPLARHIATSLLDASFDIAFSAKLQVDHGISHAIQYLLRDIDLPIVPIVVNVFAPPLPRVSRCAELGAAIRRAIEAFPDRRVAVVASGGLSHRLPWPDWRSPSGEDEAFLVEAFLNGRANWTDYEVRRREIVIKATTAAGDAFRVNSDFDRAFLALVERGELGASLQRPGTDLLAEAGNGGQEIRTWIAMTAALGNAPGRILAYEDIPEWLTGMAVAVLA